MVQVKYKGLNTLFIGGYAIKAGYNEISDKDFYDFMRTKTFSYRVLNKILEVPPGFPLEKPPAFKKPESPSDSSPAKVDDAEDKDSEPTDRLSVKATLKLIDKSEDGEYLQSLIDKDTRPKVIEEAKKKLKSLNE
jgi:hypothetical protein